MKRMRQAMVLLIALVPLLGGCLGYRLGTTLPPGIRSLHVPTFVNLTGEPGLESETATTASVAPTTTTPPTAAMSGNERIRIP